MKFALSLWLLSTCDGSRSASSVWVSAAPFKGIVAAEISSANGTVCSVGCLFGFFVKCLWDILEPVCVCVRVCVRVCWCVLRWQLCSPTVRCAFFFFARLWVVTCLCTQASKSHAHISHLQQSPCASGAVSCTPWQTGVTWYEVLTWFFLLDFFLLPSVALCVCVCVCVCVRVWERETFPWRWTRNKATAVWSKKWESLGKEWNNTAWNFYG